MRISVYGSRELRGVILGAKSLDRTIRKHTRRETKAVVDPVWRQAVAEEASTRPEARVLASTARIQVSDQNVMLQSARVGRSMTGGAKPADIWHAEEFGANRDKKTTYTAKSKKGTRYTVTRRTRAHLRPRNRKGYVVMPAAAEVIPRIASLWVQTTARALHDAFEGKAD